MTTSSRPIAARSSPLPFEPAATSLLLSSSHLFTIEITTVSVDSWTIKDDGLDHRTLSMHVKLINVLKGQLRQIDGEIFTVDVDQEREGFGAVSDYHGVWSHVVPEPGPGIRYLVASVAIDNAPSDAARLLQPASCKALMPTDWTNDVFLAEQGELLAAQAAKAEPANPPLASAKALFRHAMDHGAQSNQPFAHYLWDRTERVANAERPGVRPDLLALLAAPGVSLPLRLTLLDGLDQIISVAEPRDADFIRQSGRTMITLFTDTEAGALRPRLISVSLFHLVFPDEMNARFAASDLVPDAGERERFSSALRQSNKPNAQKLLTWLSR